MSIEVSEGSARVGNVVLTWIAIAMVNIIGTTWRYVPSTSKEIDGKLSVRIPCCTCPTSILRLTLSPQECNPPRFAWRPKVIYILEERPETGKPRIQGHLGWGSERGLHLIVVRCREELDEFCPSVVSPALASYSSQFMVGMGCRMGVISMIEGNGMGGMAGTTVCVAVHVGDVRSGIRVSKSGVRTRIGMMNDHPNDANAPRRALEQDVP